jgi:hypothetical protein
MTKDKEKTVVIFRKWNHNKDIIAFFPHEFWMQGNTRLCQSYEHIGQHGGAEYNHCLKSTTPAKPKEYASLKKELEGIGYNLLVRKRASLRQNRHKP